MVIFSRSPPKAWMFARTQVRASRWSRKPGFLFVWSSSGEGVKPNTVTFSWCCRLEGFTSFGKLTGHAVVDDHGDDVVFRRESGGVVGQSVSIASLEIAAVDEEQDGKTAGLRCVLRSVDVEMETVFALGGVVTQDRIEGGFLVPRG